MWWERHEVAITWMYRCPSLMLLVAPCVPCLCLQPLMVTGDLLRPASPSPVPMVRHPPAPFLALLFPGLVSLASCSPFLGKGPTSWGRWPLGHLPHCALVLIPVACQADLVVVLCQWYCVSWGPASAPWLSGPLRPGFLLPALFSEPSLIFA